MAEYKRQHYLPAVYLKHFSTDQENPTRHSKIWRSNGGKSILVPVERQCVENYHYSKRQAAQTEGMFQKLEEKYLDYLVAIRAGGKLTQESELGFIVLMFDLHLRNAAYENLTGLEGIHAYEGRFQALKSMLLLRFKDNPSDDEMAIYVRKYWRLRVLLGLPAYPFLTSDHPSAFLAAKGQPTRFVMAILPLTPLHIAFAYDRRFVKWFSDKMLPEDVSHLIHMQCYQAQKYVYSSLPLSPETGRVVAEIMSRPAKRRGVTERTSWTAALLSLPAKGFSFLRIPESPVTY